MKRDLLLPEVSRDWNNLYLHCRPPILERNLLFYKYFRNYKSIDWSDSDVLWIYPPFRNSTTISSTEYLLDSMSNE